MKRSTTLTIALLIPFALAAVGCSNPETAKREALERGNRYLADGKPAEAIIEYRNALSTDERFLEARQKLADAYAASGNVAAAGRELIRVADLLPDDAEAQVRAGQVLLMAREFEDARTRGERAVAKDPSSVAAHLLLANATAGLRDFDGAIEEIEEAIKLEPTNSRTHENFAVLQLAAGRRDEAEALFKKAVELDPTSVSAVLALASFYWTAGQPVAAEPLLKQALDLDPNSFLAHRAMAAFYLGSGRPLEAEVHIKNLARIAATPRAEIALADYYLLTGRPEAAEAVLQPIANSPSAVASDVASAQTGLAQIAYARRQPEKAHLLVDAAITRQPQSVLALGLKARFLLAETKLVEAEEVAARAVKAEPGSAAAHYLLGTIQLRRNDYTAATQSFNEVLKANPRAMAAKVQLARLLLARGSVIESTRMAQEVLKDQPANIDAKVALARGLAARGETDAALREIAALLKTYPTAAAAYAAQGAILLERTDVRGARAAFERASTLRRDSIEALAGLVAIDLIERRPAEAAARVEERLAQQPDDPALLLLAARAYAVNGDRAKTESTLRKVVEIAPGSDQATWMLAQYYAADRQPDAAVAQFDRLSNERGNLAAGTLAAMLVEGQGRVDEAAKRYEAILSKNANAAVAANNLAWIYAERGERLDEAQRLAQKAAELAPKDHRVLDTVGWVYYRRNLPLLAVPQFERAIALDPNNAEYHYHAGLAFSRTGNAARARQSLERALELQPDFRGSDDARQMLAAMK